MQRFESMKNQNLVINQILPEEFSQTFENYSTRYFENYLTRHFDLWQKSNNSQVQESNDQDSQSGFSK